MKFIFRFLFATWVIFSPAARAQSPGVDFWENDIRKFEYLDSTEHYSPDAILFTGSSSIRLWDSLARDMAPYPVIQRGYGGAKLSDYLVYEKRIIYPHPCRAIVFFIANDIVGSPLDKTPEQVAAMVKQAIDIVRDRFPEVPIFWIAITPTSSRWKVWPQVHQANALIKEVCDADPHATFISTDEAFLNGKGMPKDELFRADRLHLNDAGYKIWKEIIKKELDQQLP